MLISNQLKGILPFRIKTLFAKALRPTLLLLLLVAINVVSCIMFIGSVYFVVKTAVGTDTNRKRRMAERKTASNFSPAERPKSRLKP